MTRGSTGAPGPVDVPDSGHSAARTPLTRRSAAELAAGIRTGSTTSAEVVDAHIAVLERTRRCNALAADRFADARDEAARADAAVAAGHDLPPLHGVPVSVKELIAVAGMPNSGGMPHRRRHRAPADSPAVARLREAGAIVLGVGNTPGPYYWVESNNMLYGRTSNAYDPRRTAGGSSGGDGAIVGSGGAPVALGSDMGGSIRIPAFFNGVFGHLPSPGLVPITGHFPMPAGGFRRTLYLGPLARRAEDLMPVLRIIAGPDGQDPIVRPMDLGDPDAVPLAGLPVLVSSGSSTVPVRAELATALESAARALESAGATVSETSTKALRWSLAQFAGVVAAETDLLEMWLGITAPTHPGRGRPPLWLLPPTLVLRAVEAAPSRFLRSRAAGRLVDAARRASDTLAATVGDGVLLHPPFPRLAPLHRTTTAQPWLLTNTLAFNLLGLPVTQIPLGLNGRGLPLGVQAVAAPGNDHVGIRVALELERAFGGWVDPLDAPGRTAR